MRKLKVVGAPLLILFVSTAEASISNLLDVYRDQSGRLFLTAPSCQELIEENDHLRKWRMFYGEDPLPYLPPSPIPEDSKCQLQINDSIPSIAEKLEGSKTFMNGPNCWNTTLYLSSIVRERRFSSESEMTFWMDSPYCQPLDSRDKPTAGDIIAIRAQSPNGRGFLEIHGMIYISEQLVFSKNTSSRISPYGIQRANLIYQTFKLTEDECMNIQDSKTNCHRWSNMFRCKSHQSDLEQYNRLHPEFAKLYFQANEISRKISSYATDGQGDLLARRAEISIALKSLVIDTNNFREKSGAPPFFPLALLEELNSLNIQISLLK